jgi:hypothetical protein
MAGHARHRSSGPNDLHKGHGRPARQPRHSPPRLRPDFLNGRATAGQPPRMSTAPAISTRERASSLVRMWETCTSMVRRARSSPPATCSRSSTITPRSCSARSGRVHEPHTVSPARRTALARRTDRTSQRRDRPRPPRDPHPDPDRAPATSHGQPAHLVNSLRTSSSACANTPAPPTSPPPYDIRPATPPDHST